jgi:hypothetical protein
MLFHRISSHGSSDAACPAVIDLRSPAERLIPSSLRRPAHNVVDWADEFAGNRLLSFATVGQEKAPERRRGFGNRK